MANAAEVPFDYEIRPTRGGLEIQISGYLDSHGSERYLRELEARVLAAKPSPDGRVGLLYFDRLAGFETGRVARLHGEWFNRMNPHLTRVAIVTQRMAVTLALSVAKLISKTPLEQFRDEQRAREWMMVDPHPVKPKKR